MKNEECQSVETRKAGESDPGQCGNNVIRIIQQPITIKKCAKVSGTFNSNKVFSSLVLPVLRILNLRLEGIRFVVFSRIDGLLFVFNFYFPCSLRLSLSKLSADRSDGPLQGSVNLTADIITERSAGLRKETPSAIAAVNTDARLSRRVMFPHQVSCVPLYPKDGKVTNRAQEEYDAEGNLVPAAPACMLHAERISYETAAASSYFFLFSTTLPPFPPRGPGTSLCLVCNVSASTSSAELPSYFYSFASPLTLPSHNSGSHRHRPFIAVPYSAPARQRISATSSL